MTEIEQVQQKIAADLLSKQNELCEAFLISGAMPRDLLLEIAPFTFHVEADKFYATTHVRMV
jgi:hypothetical protein